MKVKFCGFTNQQDVDDAVNLGVDALGFIFYDKSPRYVSADVVQELVYFLPPFVTTVGVFVNHDLDFVNKVVKQCNLDFVQLHGDESPDYCMKVKGKIIKAVRVSSAADLTQIAKYQGLVSSIILDTKIDGVYGGTGKSFDWGIALSAKQYDVPIILSGGVAAENLSKAIDIVNPYAIDLVSSIEAEPGKKDYNKMKEILDHVR